jgi:hypothetical protein
MQTQGSVAREPQQGAFSAVTFQTVMPLLLCRCHQPCVCKWFKTGEVYEDTFYEKDLKAVEKAQEFIDAFNDLQLANTIHLNRPTVWQFKPGCRYGRGLLQMLQVGSAT